MYSTARKLSVFSAILCCFNITGTALFLIYQINADWAFSLRFSTTIILVSATVISLLLTIGMRSLCHDLEYEYEDNAKRFRDLTKRVRDLEIKAG